MNIFVGNISFKMTDADLKSTFEQYGDVSSAKVIKDKFSGRSRGFGFVEMPDQEEASAAMEALNESEVMGRPLRVNEAQPRQSRPRRNDRA